jgi:hypothetical protein
MQIFTSAFSSGNSCTFLASRTLHGLALDGQAPRIFLQLNRYDVPWVAVMASTVWGAVAYLSVNKGSFQVLFPKCSTRVSWLTAETRLPGVYVACFACHDCWNYLLDRAVCHIPQVLLCTQNPRDLKRLPSL